MIPLRLILLGCICGVLSGQVLTTLNSSVLYMLAALVYVLSACYHHSYTLIKMPSYGFGVLLFCSTFLYFTAYSIEDHPEIRSKAIHALVGKSGYFLLKNIQNDENGGCRLDGTWYIEDEEISERFAIRLKIRKCKREYIVGNTYSFRMVKQNKISKNTPYSFDYQEYLYSNGIDAYLLVNDEALVLTNRERNLFYWGLEECRKYISNCFIKHLSTESVGLATALFLGNKSGLDNEIYRNFQASGLMHVLAVSGMHVSILFYILSQLISRIPGFSVGSVPYVICSIAMLVVYAALTGGSPAVIRAGIMGGVLSFGLYLKRKNHRWNTLAISLILQLSMEPMGIWHIGFQLSYVAVIGIFCGIDFFREKYRHLNSLWVYILDCLTISILAQWATFPLCIYYFHQFPVYFLLSNILTAPLVSIGLGGIVCLVSVAYIPFLSTIVGIVTDFLLNILCKIAEHIEKLPLSTIKVNDFSCEWMLFFYGIWMLLYLSFQLSSVVLFRITALLLSCWAILHLIGIYPSFQETYAVLHYKNKHAFSYFPTENKAYIHKDSCKNCIKKIAELNEYFHTDVEIKTHEQMSKQPMFKDEFLHSVITPYINKNSKIRDEFLIIRRIHHLYRGNRIEWYCSNKF